MNIGGGGETTTICVLVVALRLTFFRNSFYSKIEKLKKKSTAKQIFKFLCKPFMKNYNAQKVCDIIRRYVLTFETENETKK